MGRTFTHLQRGAALGLLCMLASNAQASGFRLTESSILGLATANAQVANSNDIGALSYNPAAMGFHDKNAVAIGVASFNLNATYTRTTGQEFESNVDTPFYLPNIYIMGQIANNVAAGLAINTPFGLETNWPLGSFATLAAIDPDGGLPLTTGALQTTRSKVEMFNVNPNLAYKMGNTSVAAGLDYYTIKDTRLDGQDIKISGDGADWGYNLAVLHKMGAVNIGFSYHSEVEVDMIGTVQTTPNSAEGIANVNLTLPSFWQLGARYQATDKLAVEADVEFTDWSVIDVIRVYHNNPTPSVASPINNTNSWEDTYTYRLGTSYDLSASTQLRAGYAYDENPQPDARFSARLPDSTRNSVSLGMGQKFGNWNLELAYMHVKLNARSVNSTVPFGTYGSDSNGTSVYNGTYRGSADVFGLGISTSF